VGGMADTILDPGADADSDAMTKASGVLFDGDSVDAMFNAIQRAMDMFKRPELWRAIQRTGMTADYSWDMPAGQYIDIYRDLLPASAFEAQPLVAVAEAVKQVANPTPALGVATPDADVTPPKAVVKRTVAANKPQAKAVARKDTGRKSSTRDAGGIAAAGI